MIAILVPCIILVTGLYFIWRSERKEKRAKVVKMDLDEHEKEISK